MDDVLDDIILAIHNNLPQYNEDMLKRYTEREVNNSPDVVELIFKHTECADEADLISLYWWL